MGYQGDDVMDQIDNILFPPFCFGGEENIFFLSRKNKYQGIGIYGIYTRMLLSSKLLPDARQPNFGNHLLPSLL